MPFRVFRIITGAILAMLALWMFWTNGVKLGAALSSGAEASAAVVPVAWICVAVLVLVVYYYCLWTQSSIRRNLENIFSIPELLRKIAFTLALLCIYRVGFYVPLAGLDQAKVKQLMNNATSSSGGVFAQALQLGSMFTGGQYQYSTLFGLGIMPYISASIIFQLLATVLPSLQKLQKEGPAGYKKIQEYTRYATVVLCVIQATVYMNMMFNPQSDLVYPKVREEYGRLAFMAGLMGLTAGTLFLMWLGEQIDEYGIGNGVSLLIMAGIIARLPEAIIMLGNQANLSLTATSSTGVGPLQILFLAGAFVFVVAGSILITQAQRRIPVQQAKQMRGRRVYGGQRHYMPLRVNHGGVMPLIFASSLMIFPGLLFGWLNKMNWQTGTFWYDVFYNLNQGFSYGSYIYCVIEVVMIFFFSYFWTTVQFRPKEMAEQLRDSGSFIPGLRPGKRTADYLERVMERITYCGAAFLSVIAVIPMVVANAMGINARIAQFLGGTGLLIVVSVTLDLVQRIESNLVMRNYGGFLGGSTRIKGAYT